MANGKGAVRGGMGVEDQEGTPNGTSDNKATDKASVMFSMPTELKQLVDDDAEKQDKSVAALVRQLVADHYGFTLPKVTRERAKKYATAEEREAAQKERANERNAIIKALLAEYRKGNIQVDLPVEA